MNPGAHQDSIIAVAVERLVINLQVIIGIDLAWAGFYARKTASPSRSG